MKTAKRSVGIVGGGVLGMTLALRLSERGFKVTLIEGDSRMGGLASSMKIGNYTWDRFYHVILLSDSDLLDLLEMLGLRKDICWGRTKTGFFMDGHLYSMSNVIEFLTFPPLTLLDKFRLGWTIFYASKIKEWRKLDEILVSDWLKRLSGQKTFHKIWLPLLKSKLGENYNLTSATFIWAIIARMYGARKSGLKKEMFGYVKGGYARIIDRFQRYLDERGVKTLCQTHVTKISAGKNGVETETSTGQSLMFGEVILTIPCSKIPEMCPQISWPEKERFQEILYQGVICAVLILRKPLTDYYITNITDEKVPFTAVIEMTNLVASEYFDGNSLVYLPRYMIAEDLFWKKTDKEIEGEFIVALESMYPKFNRENLLLFKVSRASQVLPVVTLNYSTELLPPTNTSVNHVFVVNSAQIASGTLNVNEIVGLADRKAAEIADYLS